MNYDECTEKTVYKMNANMFASYSYYKRGLPGDEWELENNYMVNVPGETLWSENGILFAEKN